MKHRGPWVLEDKLLIRRFNRGETEALRRIYEKNRLDLLKVAHILLNDSDAVEDVLHDVFVNFAQQSGVFRLTGSLKGYLAICVANRARDHNRRRRPTTLPADDLKTMRSHVEDPAYTAYRLELQKMLAHTLAQLPDDQREVIALRLHANLPFRRIAQLTEVSINTVQSRYRYGLEKLQRLLDGRVQ